MLIIHSRKTTIADFLSLILVSYLTEDTRISHISHTDATSAIEDTSEVCITLGTEPASDTYPRTKASFIGVADLHGIALSQDSLWDYFGDVITEGYEKARKTHNMTVKKADSVNDIVQPILRTWDLVIAEGTVNADIFVKISDFLAKQGFNLTVYQLKGIESRVRKAYPEQYEEATKQLAKEK